jgi:hypothetical protein
MYLERRLESGDGFFCALETCTESIVSNNKYILISFKQAF